MSAATTPDVTVEVVFDVVVGAGTTTGRARTLVLRRAVRAGDPDGDPAVVEEIRVGEPCRTRAELVRCVEASVTGLPVLLRGRDPGPALGLRHADPDTLDALGAALRDGRVERIAEFRGTVRDLTGDPFLTDADVTLPVPSAAGRAAERVLARALHDLGVREAAPPPARGGDDGTSTGHSGDGGVGGEVAAAPVLGEVLDCFRHRLAVLDRADAQAGRELVPVGPRLRSGDDGPVLVSWQRPDRLGLEPEHTSPGTDRVVVTFVEVDGLQIGRDNRQTNVYSYRLRPDVDLRGVLGRPAVQEAMHAYATAPPHATPDELRALRTAAVEAVHAAARPPSPDAALPVPEPHRMVAPYSEVVEDHDRTIVVQDCRGVQIGDRSRQVNEFAYTLSPTVDAAGLLRGNAELVNALVDDVCRPPSSGPGSVHGALCEAVGARAHASYDRGPDAGVVTGRAGPFVADTGLTWGPRARQHNRTEVAVEFGRALDRQVEQAQAAAERARRLAELTRVAQIERQRADAVADRVAEPVTYDPVPAPTAEPWRRRGERGLDPGVPGPGGLRFR